MSTPTPSAHSWPHTPANWSSTHGEPPARERAAIAMPSARTRGVTVRMCSGKAHSAISSRPYIIMLWPSYRIVKLTKALHAGAMTRIR